MICAWILGALLLGSVPAISQPAGNATSGVLVPRRPAVAPTVPAAAATVANAAPKVCAYVAVAAGNDTATAYAATELSRWLSAAARCPVPVVASGTSAPLQVAVLIQKLDSAAGSSAEGARLDEMQLPQLPMGAGTERFRLQAHQSPAGVSYSVRGAGPRGAIYGAFDFLERVIGFQFLAHNVTTVPPLIHGRMPQLPHLDIESSPAFAFRSLGYSSVLTKSGAEFSAVVRDNSIDWKADAKPGQGVYYANPPGGCHTAFRLIPPAKYQASHPDWFGGYVRDAEGMLAPTQLCWAAPGLVAALIEAVQADLRFGVNRNATVVSVSQNDGGTYCNSSAEMAVIAAEGSPAGPLLRAVNAVADAIAVEFPAVLVDTLAYQFTLPPPRVTKPRKNTIVRIGTMGANFRLPLNSTANAEVAESFVGWASVAAPGQIWAWHYAVNFPNYVSPFPNYGVMGADLRFFRSLGVRGVYYEGDGYAGGSDMAELKTWLLGKLLWDPDLDDTQLTNTFLRAYYGPAVAPYIARYMQLFVAAAANTSTILDPEANCLPGPALCAGRMDYLAPETMLRSLSTLQEAASALGTAAPPELRARLRVAELPTLYVILIRWASVRAWAAAHGQRWPLSEDISVVYNRFAQTYTEHGMDVSVWCPEVGDCASCSPCRDNALGEWPGAGLTWFKKQIGALDVLIR
eukprot:SAG11_NODE_2302_length_3548_cov_2.637866_3_plen_687_part_00